MSSSLLEKNSQVDCARRLNKAQASARGVTLEARLRESSDVLRSSLMLLSGLLAADVPSSAFPLLAAAGLLHLPPITKNL